MEQLAVQVYEAPGHLGPLLAVRALLSRSGSSAAPFLSALCYSDAPVELWVAKAEVKMLVSCFH